MVAVHRATRPGEVRGEKMDPSETVEVRGEKMDPSTTQGKRFSREDEDKINLLESSVGQCTFGPVIERLLAWECMYLGKSGVGTDEERLKVILDIGAARMAKYPKKDVLKEYWEMKEIETLTQMFRGLCI